MNNSERLPLFPLGIFSFPNEEVVLHVFEDKYKSLVKDVLSNKKQFIVPFVLNGDQQRYGNLVEIIKVDNVANNGEMDIRIKSLSIVKIGEVFFSEENNEYSTGIFIDLGIRNRRPNEKLLTLYTQYLMLRQKDKLDASNFDDIDLFKIAQGTNAPSYQKFNLIEGETSKAFERNLVNFLLLQIKIETMTREMGPKFVLN